MDYSQSLAYLSSFYDLEKTMHLPASRRWKLARMRRLLALFGNPQKNFLPVIIVGTKGKGSTGFFLQSILNAAGIAAGFYSSPHLVSPRERIRIKGQWISRRLWTQGMVKIRQRLSKSSQTALGAYTYFEIMTLLALLAFKEAGVQIAVFEAGMGGRLDAVNALGAKVVIVTPVYLDHQEFLGNTIAKIAAEKAAVISRNADVILAPQLPEARGIVLRRAKQQRARVWSVIRKTGLPVGLTGEHQAWNAAAAKQAAEVAAHAWNVWQIEKSKHRRMSDMKLFSISMRAVRLGLSATDWPGRFEVVSKAPKILLDGAHNPASVEVLVRELSNSEKHIFKSRRILIFGVAQDKDSVMMLKTLSRFFSTIIISPLPHPRCKTVSELVGEGRGFFQHVIPARDIEAVLKIGRALAGRPGLIVATGSFYLLGAIKSLLEDQ